MSQVVLAATGATIACALWKSGSKAPFAQYCRWSIAMLKVAIVALREHVRDMAPDFALDPVGLAFGCFGCRADRFVVDAQKGLMHRRQLVGT